MRRCRGAPRHAAAPARFISAARSRRSKRRSATRGKDASRAPAGRHTLWAYCHVPNGSTVDMGERIDAQIERFAPGFRDVVVARHVTTPADFAATNANEVGGDIAGGAHRGLQLVFRPTISVRPYHTPDPTLFLCSASTPRSR